MSTQTGESYGEQLQRMTRALATAQLNGVAADVAPGSSALGVKMFVDGNLDKRFEKLADALEFVAPAFKKFDEQIVAFIRSTPLAPYDTGVSDSERMLVWLEQTRRLTARQQDYVVCQRTRHAVEERARENRLAYVRFEERRSVTASLLPELAGGTARVYLNPIRIWATLQTKTLLDAAAEPPCRVVFFPVAGEISTAVLDDRGLGLLAELEHLAPISFTSWAATTAHSDSDELLETIHDLAEMGLAAVA